MAPQIEAWFRELEADRLEFFVRVSGMAEVPDCKVRASGPEEVIYKLADWFEEYTGLQIQSDARRWRRARTGPKPPPGQTALVIPMGELSSSNATLDSHG